jgi:hypothetical protein
MLIHLLELYAKNKWMERYMDEIIGARSIEEEVYRKVEEEFEEKKEQKNKEKRTFLGGLRPKYALNDKMEYAPNALMRLIRFFVKPGPYEPVFFERVSKMYMRASGFYYKQMLDLIQGTMGIE